MAHRFIRRRRMMLQVSFLLLQVFVTLFASCSSFLLLSSSSTTATIGFSLHTTTSSSSFAKQQRRKGSGVFQLWQTVSNNNNNDLADKDDVELLPPPPPQTAFKPTTTTNNTTTFIAEGNITVLATDHHQTYLVISKDPSIVCHHSEWTGSRSKTNYEIPILQRVREAVSSRSSSSGQRQRYVNLVHRLDRGCSGCLLMTYADADADDDSDDSQKQVTSNLITAMKHSNTIKTYIAFVRGEGILHGRNFLTEQDWFLIDTPIKSESGVLKDARTWFKFIAGQDNGNGTIDRPRASIVLCRPETGRWHQIRKHLKSISHPILGDSSHGNSKLNREWKQKYNLLSERTCLHLLQINLVSNPSIPNDRLLVTCPLAYDMLYMLQQHFLPTVIQEVEDYLERELGIVLRPTSTSTPPLEQLPYKVIVHRNHVK